MHADLQTRGASDHKAHKSYCICKTHCLRAMIFLKLLLVIIVSPSASMAEEPEPFPKSDIICKPANNRLICDVDLRKLFEDDLLEELTSGFQNNIILKAYLFSEGDEEPLGLTIQRVLQIFDIWDEVHFVRDQFEEAPVTQITSHRSMLNKIAKMDKLVVADLEDLPPGTYFVGLLIELNPLSDKEIAEIRSWITRNRGGHRTFAKGERTFFGTFVSIFVNIRPGSAEKILRLRSDPVDLTGK